MHVNEKQNMTKMRINIKRWVSEHNKKEKKKNKIPADKSGT